MPPRLVKRLISINKLDFVGAQYPFLNLFMDPCHNIIPGASSLLTTVVVTAGDPIGPREVIHQRGSIRAGAREWDDGSPGKGDVHMG